MEAAVANSMKPKIINVMTLKGVDKVSILPIHKEQKKSSQPLEDDIENWDDVIETRQKVETIQGEKEDGEITDESGEQ